LFPAGLPERIVAGGGGARNDLLMEIAAEVLGVELAVPLCAEPACLGAAIFASVAAGWYSNIEQAAAHMTSLGTAFIPGRGTVFVRTPMA